MPQDNQKKLIDWSFPEFIKHERSKWWYVITFGLSVLLIIFAALTANWLFALIIIMVDAILIIMQNKEPVEVEFSITNKGVRVGQKFYAFKELENFWIIYEPSEVKKLFFVFKSKVRPRISIPLMNTNPLKVRQILLEYLEEDLDKESEPTSESLARLLKI